MHSNVFRFIWLFLLIPAALLPAPLSISVSAESAILLNAETGAILYEKNGNALQYPASITKVATAAYALKERGHALDAIVIAEHDAVASITEEARRRSNYTVPAHWLVPGSSTIGIKKGEELTLQNLLYGMMVSSGNDAANVIAHHVGGAIPDCMVGMNLYLKEIGCRNTTFYNPHGLHHPKHQTTACDMALIAREALKDPEFRKIVATVRYTRPKTNKQAATTLVQTNRLLRTGQHYYAKAIGIKTGYTSLASHTLVAAATQEDRTLIAVLLKTKERDEMFRDAVKMFEAAFAEEKVQCQLLKSGPQHFHLDVEGGVKTITTYMEEDVNVAYYPAEEPEIKCLLYWNALTPPIAAGQQVGELHVQVSMGKGQIVPLLAQEEVKATWLFSLKHAVGGLHSFLPAAKRIAIAGTIIFLLAFFMRRYIRTRK